MAPRNEPAPLSAVEVTISVAASMLEAVRAKKQMPSARDRILMVGGMKPAAHLFELR
jgi:hypothetical protein